MLSDQELRLECLRLAVQAGVGTLPPVQEAEKMFDFVRGFSGGAGINRPVERPSIFDLRPQDAGIPS